MTALLLPASETELRAEPPAPPSLPPVLQGMPKEDAVRWLLQIYAANEHGHAIPNDNELIDAWLPVCSRSGSKETVDAYRRELQHLRDWLSIEADGLSLREVDPVVADRWVRSLRAQVDAGAMACRSFNRRLAAISSFYGWCSDPARSGWSAVPRNPLPRKSYLQVTANPKPLTEPDLARVVAAIESSSSRLARRDLVLLKGGYLIGARVSEIAFLTWGSIEALADGGQITIERGKGGKSRTIRVSQATLDLFLSIKPDGAMPEEFVFPSSRRPGQPLTRQAIGARAKLWGMAAVGGSVRLWPHRLRSSHATHAVRKGVDVFLLSASLGHSGIGSVQSYVRANPSTSSSMFLG